MKTKKTSILSIAIFKMVKFFVRLFYGKTEIIGMENLPENNAIIVSNHAKMNGPIIGELFMPENSFTWCAGEMMKTKDVPSYAFRDFWSKKGKWSSPFYKGLSYIIAPLASCIFNNARTIAVYHDARLISTFRETVRMLENNNNILIFPEKNEKLNNIIYKLQDRFIDVAKLYYKKTGSELIFVPMYIAPNLKKAYIGKGIKFDSKKDIKEERARIITYISDEITKIARELPPHIVIPYENIPKKRYLSNKDITEVPNEKSYM